MHLFHLFLSFSSYHSYVSVNHLLVWGSTLVICVSYVFYPLPLNLYAWLGVWVYISPPPHVQ